MNDEAKNSPRPWRINAKGDLLDANGNWVSPDDLSEFLPFIARAANLADAAGDMLAALRAAEWGAEVGDEDGDPVAACPVCDGEQRHGHNEGCLLAAAGAKAEGADVKPPTSDPGHPSIHEWRYAVIKGETELGWRDWYDQRADADCIERGVMRPAESDGADGRS